MDTEETGCEEVDGIKLAQDEDKRRLLVNTAINIRVPKQCRVFSDL
jgi:hypothetical protein